MRASYKVEKFFFTILSISSGEDERNFMMRRIERIKIFGSKSLGTIHVRIMQEESRLLSKQPVEKSKRSDAECCTQPISPTCRLLHAPMYENLLFEEAASSKYKNAALLKYSCVTRASNIYSFYDVLDKKITRAMCLGFPPSSLFNCTYLNGIGIFVSL